MSIRVVWPIKVYSNPVVLLSENGIRYNIWDIEISLSEKEPDQPNLRSENDYLNKIWYWH